MCIRPKGMKDFYFPMAYLNNNVKVVTKEKYLGVFLEDDKSDDGDVFRQTRGIYARGNVLIKNVKYCTGEIKSLLFKTYCIGFYCNSVWSTYKSKSYNKVKVACTNICRVFMGHGRQESISKKMIDMFIDRFKVVIRKYIVEFMKILDCCESAIVNTLYKWLDFTNCKLYKVWFMSAYC